VKLPYVLLTLAYCAGIFWLSSQQIVLSPELIFPGQDKLVHMILFGGLAAVVSTGLRRSGREVPPVAQFYVPVVFAAVYGLSDEIHQLFVPTRSFDLADVLADVLGAFLVQWILCFRAWRIPVRAVFPGK